MALLLGQFREMTRNGMRERGDDTLQGAKGQTWTQTAAARTKLLFMGHTFCQPSHRGAPILSFNQIADKIY